MSEFRNCMFLISATLSRLVVQSLREHRSDRPETDCQIKATQPMPIKSLSSGHPLVTQSQIFGADARTSRNASRTPLASHVTGVTQVGSADIPGKVTSQPSSRVQMSTESAPTIADHIRSGSSATGKSAQNSHEPHRTNATASLIQNSENAASLTPSAVGSGSQGIVTIQDRKQPCQIPALHMVGFEVELNGAILDGVAAKNFFKQRGYVLGESKGNPGIRLDLEGGLRTKWQTPIIEMVTTPILENHLTQDGGAFPFAFETLKSNLTSTKFKTLGEAIFNYNGRVSERFRMDIMEGAGEIKLKAKPANGGNQQTNINMAFRDIGTGKYDNIFADTWNRKNIIGVARSLAERACSDAKIKNDVIKSFLTYVTYQEIIYKSRRLDDAGVAEKVNIKHHFDTLIKSSPQDIIFSILSREDAKELLAANDGGKLEMGLLHGAGQFIGSASRLHSKRLHRILSNDMKIRAEISERQLVQQGGREDYFVIDDAGQKIKIVKDTPRANGTIPPALYKETPCIVAEIRTASHPFNRNQGSAGNWSKIFDEIKHER
ncbi:hypothetical protein [Burkholderia ubonensis]|uniref:hypothetical protein n=1 Tax=Burkholderia ubonensis TaxID=101571 RepID=UPI000AC9EA59|nr:hypothetical protein [Burkholderia ubonensis]